MSENVDWTAGGGVSALAKGAEVVGILVLGVGLSILVHTVSTFCWLPENSLQIQKEFYEIL